MAVLLACDTPPPLNRGTQREATHDHPPKTVSSMTARGLLVNAPASLTSLVIPIPTFIPSGHGYYF